MRTPESITYTFTFSPLELPHLRRKGKRLRWCCDTAGTIVMRSNRNRGRIEREREGEEGQGGEGRERFESF
jgi:hypothetical protein